MRWCSFTAATGGPARLGAVSAWDDSGRVLDVAGWARSREAETPPDLVDLIESSPATQERVTDLVRSAPADGVGWVRPEELRFLAPLRAPNTLRQVVARDGAVPVFTYAGRRAVRGPDEDLSFPSYTQQLDFAGQVAAVVGRAARDVDPSEAAATVFGYAVMAHWSARDVAREVATSFGPWLVTPDEWEPRAGHALTVSVDGEPWSSGTTGSSPWTVGQVLSWVSQGDDLLPTDVVGLGASSGLCGRDLDRWIRPGQSLTLDIEGLGTVHTTLSPDPSTGSP